MDTMRLSRSRAAQFLQIRVECQQAQALEPLGTRQNQRYGYAPASILAIGTVHRSCGDHVALARQGWHRRGHDFHPIPSEMSRADV
jgi:hypothetical protein